MTHFIKIDIKIAFGSFFACTLTHYVSISKTMYDHKVLYDSLKASTNQNVLAFANLQMICNTCKGKPWLFCASLLLNFC